MDGWIDGWDGWNRIGREDAMVGGGWWNMVLTMMLGICVVCGPVYRLGWVEGVVTGTLWQHGHDRGSRTGIRQW